MDKLIPNSSRGLCECVHAGQYIMVKQKRKSLIDQQSTNKKVSNVTGHPLEQPECQGMHKEMPEPI